jgi:hypothetical protein
VAAELAGKDPWALSATDESYAACSEDNTHLNPFGVNPDGLPTGAGAGSKLGGFQHPQGYYDHLRANELEAAHTH